MPDVGVLELQIHDNADQAGAGLRNLADALSAVKNAQKSFNLSKVGQELVNLTQIIQKARGTSTTIKNLGTMFNAINKFSNLKNFSIDAEKIRDTANNLIKLAEAKERVDAASKSSTAAGDWRSNMAQNAATVKKDLTDAVKAEKERSNITSKLMEERETTGRKSLMSLKLQQFGGRKSTTDLEEVASRQIMLNYERLEEYQKALDEYFGKADIKTSGSKKSPVDNMLAKTSETIEHVSDEYKNMVGGMENTKVDASGLDTSNFDVSKMPISIVNTSLQEAKEGMTNFGDMAKDSFKTLLDSGILDSVKGIEEMQQGETGLILYAENLENTWERIASRIDETKEKTEEITGLSASGTKVEEPRAEMPNVDATKMQLGNIGSAFQNVQDNVSTVGDMARDSFQSLLDNGILDSVRGIEEMQHGETGLILYADNLENSWERIVSRIDEAKEKAEDIAGLAAGKTNVEEARSEMPSLSTEKMELDSMGTAFEGVQDSVSTVGDMARDSFQTLLDNGILDSVKGIEEMQQGETGLILYADNLENSWERIAARIDEAKQKAEDAANVSNPFQRTEEQIQTRKQSLMEEDQARLERNYPAFRELALSGEGDWNQQVQGMYGFTPTALEQGETYAEALKITMQEVNDYVDKFIASIGTPVDSTLKDSIEKSLGMLDPVKSAKESAEVFKNLPEEITPMVESPVVEAPVSGIEEVASSVQEAVPALDQLRESVANGSKPTTILTENLKDLDKEMKQKKTDSLGLKDSFKKLFDIMRSGVVGKLAKQFWNIGKRMAIRAIIKQVSSAFQEGTENVYRYSQAIGGSFASDMDNAATSLLQMKNSIGAAVAPAIQALLPFVNQLVHGFIEAVNTINQLFSLLNGQATWTKAVPYATKAYDDINKNAKGAAKATKDLLADWDELNIIQSQNDGSGVGGTGKKIEDYSKMFEEVSTFDSKVVEIADYIKSLIDFVTENVGEILSLVTSIKWAAKLTKFSGAFTGVISDILGLASAGIIVKLTVDAISMLDNKFLETGNEGYLVANILTSVLGGFFMKKVLKNVLGGQLAKFAIPLTLTVSAVTDIVTLVGKNDVSALSKESIEMSVVSALKLGGAAAYLSKFIFGNTLGVSLLRGSAAALITFGVSVGLKAVKDVIDTGEITPDTIKADLLSAGTIGAGLAILAATSHVGLAGVLALGAGGAIVVFGALIGIQAILTLVKNTEKIKWGDYEATEEEIKAFVDEEIFTVTPKTTINLAKAKIDELSLNKKELEESASNVLGVLEAAKIGISENAEEDLKAELKTFISTFNLTSENYQESLKIAVSLVPVSEDTKDTKEILNNSDSRWKELNGIMKGLAEDLTKAFGTAYDESLDEETRNSAKEAIEKISGMMTQIADAISSGQAKAKAINSINAQISNLSQGTVDGIIAYYKEQRELLIQEMVKANEDAAEGTLAQGYAYQKLAEYALKDANGDITDKTYQHYLAQAQAAFDDYNKLMNNLQERAEKEADKTLRESEGAKKIREAMLSSIITPIDGKDVMDAMQRYSGLINANSDTFASEMIKLLFNDGKPTEGAKGTMSYLLDTIIQQAFGENSGEYIDAVHNGIMSYSDLIDDELIKQIARRLNIGNDSPLKEAWDTIIESLFGHKIELPEIEATQNITIKPEIEIDTDLQKEIEKAMENGVISYTEATELRDKYGVEKYIEMLNHMNIDHDVYGLHVDADKVPTEPTKVEVDEMSMTNSVSKGVNGATINVTGIDTLASLLRLILARGGTGFTGFPTDPNTGFNMAGAMGAAGKVTGDIP